MVVENGSLWVFVTPVIASGVWAAIGYVNSWMSPTHQLDKSKLMITIGLGVFLGIVSLQMNVQPTYEVITAQMVMYIGIVSVLDKGAHMLLNVYRNRPVDDGLVEE